MGERAFLPTLKGLMSMWTFLSSSNSHLLSNAGVFPSKIALVKIYILIWEYQGVLGNYIIFVSKGSRNLVAKKPALAYAFDSSSKRSKNKIKSVDHAKLILRSGRREREEKANTMVFKLDKVLNYIVDKQLSGKKG